MMWRELEVQGEQQEWESGFPIAVSLKCHKVRISSSTKECCSGAAIFPGVVPRVVDTFQSLGQDLYRFQPGRE